MCMSIGINCATNMKILDEQEFFSDLDMLPLNIVYSSDDLEVIPVCPLHLINRYFSELSRT